MTQIKLLVTMPVTDGEQDNGEPGDVPSCEHVNAVMTFSDGWVLHADPAGYPGAAAEGYHLSGAGDDPPVQAAIECLTKAMAAKSPPEADSADDSDGDDSDIEAVEAHVHGEVVEFEVPEGSTSVRARLVPEVTRQDGEIHARVKVDDPNWVRDPNQPDS